MKKKRDKVTHARELALVDAECVERVVNAHESHVAPAKGRRSSFGSTTRGTYTFVVEARFRDDVTRLDALIFNQSGFAQPLRLVIERRPIERAKKKK